VIDRRQEPRHSRVCRRQVIVSARVHGCAARPETASGCLVDAKARAYRYGAIRTIDGWCSRGERRGQNSRCRAVIGEPGPMPPLDREGAATSQIAALPRSRRSDERMNEINRRLPETAQAVGVPIGNFQVLRPAANADRVEGALDDDARHNDGEEPNAEGAAQVDQPPTKVHRRSPSYRPEGRIQLHGGSE